MFNFHLAVITVHPLNEFNNITSEEVQKCHWGRPFFYIQYSSGIDPFQYFYIIKNLKKQVP